MVNNVLALTASGVRDWLVQRVTALMIFFYVLGTTAYVGMHSPLTYEAWHALFACQKMKVVTTLVLLSVLWHAWIGLWTVFTDYVSHKGLRLLLTTCVIIFLIYNLVWGLALVWSV